MKSLNIFSLAIIFQVFSIVTFSQKTNYTLVLQPGPSQGMDADIRTDLPDTPNGSSFDFIANAWTAEGNCFNQRSLIKFDFSDIPADAEIINATLFLYTNLNTGHYQLDSGANASYLLRVIETWDENTVDWANQPQVTFNDPVILEQSISHTQSYELDVTNHVRDMVRYPKNNFGWSFRLQTEEKYRCLVFASSDNPMSLWRPKLIIQYLDCSPPLAGFSYSDSLLNVRFTDLSNNADTWLWDFGDTTSSSEQNPIHTYAFPGNYRVCLDISDSCGVSSFCDTVIVSCSLPHAGFTYTIDAATVSFTDTSLSLLPFSRHWDFDDGTYSAEQNPTHKFVRGRVYNVCLSITNACGESIDCDSVGVFEPLMPDYSATQNETENLKVAFTDKTAGATWWNWTFGDGNTSSERNPVHLYREYGSYEVCLTAGDSFTQGKECNNLAIKMTSVHPNRNNIIIFPNPFYSYNSKANFLVFEDIDLLEVTISDITGRIVSTRTFWDIRKNEPVELDLSGLEKGTFFIKCTFGNDKRIVKFVLL